MSCHAECALNEIGTECWNFIFDDFVLTSILKTYQVWMTRANVDIPPGLLTNYLKKQLLYR